MKPNILIFMTDHQRADTVRPEHPAKMPNVNAFMQEAVTFSQAYCPAPHCCPSRASFFTGLYPSQHGVWNNITNDQALSRAPKEGTRLFSDDLLAAGYDLYYSGKWHVSYEERPADKGWQELFVSSVPGVHHGRGWQDYKKGVNDSKTRQAGTIKRPGYGDFRVYGTGADTGDTHDETTVNEAVKKLAEVNTDKPWCMYVGVNAPHDPYVVPQKYLDMYDLNDVPLPGNYHDSMRDKPNLYRRLKEHVFGQLSETEVRDAIRHFWAFCSYIDDMFGRLLTALEQSGQADNTLVLFCADHGDYCGEHGLFAKGIPAFKGAYHVPAIIRYPKGVVNPGRSVDAFVSLTDFAPTFTEVSGETPAASLAGKSLMPYLKNETPDNWRTAVFTQCDGVELYYKQRSVMTKDYKYVFNGFDFDELYDLNADPHELTNLAENPELEDVKKALLQQLWQFAYEHDDTSMLNPYVTVGLAPYGPATAFSND